MKPVSGIDIPDADGEIRLHLEINRLIPNHENDPNNRKNLCVEAGA